MVAMDRVGLASKRPIGLSDFSPFVQNLCPGSMTSDPGDKWQARGGFACGGSVLIDSGRYLLLGEEPRLALRIRDE